MNKVFRAFFNTITNIEHLVASSHPNKTKLKLLLIYFIVLFKNTFINGIIPLKRQRLLNFQIESFEYGAIKFLFEDIFIKNVYYYKSDKADPVIFDCGANIGMATLFFKWMYPASKVYAFEPDKETFSLLQKNIKNNNLRDVYLFNNALTNKDGKIDFFLDSRHKGSLVMSAIPERNSDVKSSAVGISLSKFIKKEKFAEVDLIKMDIEGAECFVIRDLNKHKLLKRIRMLFVEFHHNIEGFNNSLQDFLKIFEDNNFNYLLECSSIRSNEKSKMQDVMIYFY